MIAQLSWINGARVDATVAEDTFGGKVECLADKPTIATAVGRKTRTSNPSASQGDDAPSSPWDAGQQWGAAVPTGRGGT